MGRTMIAGFGNVLRGDDGFGVVVVQRLAELPRWQNCEEVVLLEVGTGGIHMAQELLGGYERLIIVDAMTRGGSPGSVYVLEVDGVEAAQRVDMHLIIPASALSVAKALGALPARVFMVGCEPAEVEELSLELSVPVREAVEVAIHRIHALIDSESLQSGRSGQSGCEDSAKLGASHARQESL